MNNFSVYECTEILAEPIIYAEGLFHNSLERCMAILMIYPISSYYFDVNRHR